jgi:hypothetical protein
MINSFKKISVHVKLLNFGMHVHTMFGSLYKISHNYFLLRIISRN